MYFFTQNIQFNSLENMVTENEKVAPFENAEKNVALVLMSIFMILHGYRLRAKHRHFYSV